MCRPILRDTSAAPFFFASNGLTCLYRVPISARSASSSTGQLMAPGTWSSANSDGLRTSMMLSYSSREGRTSVMDRRAGYFMRLLLCKHGLQPGPDRVQQQRLRFGGRMHTVALEQVGPLQQ